MTQNRSVYLISSRHTFIDDVERAASSLQGLAIAGKAELANGSTAPAGVQAVRSGAVSAILVDLDSNASEGLRALAEITRQAPDACVLVASAERNPDLILQAMRAGATDFLSLPLERGALDDALVRAMRRGALEMGSPVARGQVLSFLSVKGGCGATTVAVNLASALCAAGPGGRSRSVILLDLDTPGGDAAAMLKLEPAYSLADVASNIHRLDMDLLASMAVRHESGLTCLAGAADPERQVGPEAMNAIVTFLRENFDTVVLAGGGLVETNLAAVAQAHMIHLVTTLDFLALRRAQQMMTRLREFGATGDCLRVVVNRYEKGADLTLSDARQALDSPVVWAIPQDTRTADRAVNEGIPFAAKGRSRLQQSYEEYASQLAKGEAAPEGRAGFGSLLKKLVPGRAAVTG